MERSASGRRGVEADEARAGEVRPLHSSNEAGEQTWATRGGANGNEPTERTEGNTVHCRADRVRVVSAPRRQRLIGKSAKLTNRAEEVAPSSPHDITSR